MTLLDWVVSTFSTTLLLAALAWLLRNLIKTRLTASVQHEFNAELESLRADLRKSEESFKADLRAKETQIEVLRSGALSGLASRQVTLDKRRLEAVEQLWAGIEVLAPLKWAASMIAPLKFEESLKVASENKQFREIFEKMSSPIDMQKISKIDVHKSRPFVSEIAWALFCAYHAVLGHAATQLQMLKVGLNAADILNSEHVSKLIKVAMPHYADYVDEHGPKGYFYTLEPLESELLKELKHMMRGEESDRASIELAVKIMKEVASVNNAISKSQTI